jgi:hypothetical protein
MHFNIVHPPMSWSSQWSSILTALLNSQRKKYVSKSLLAFSHCKIVKNPMDKICFHITECNFTKFHTGSCTKICHRSVHLEEDHITIMNTHTETYVRFFFGRGGGYISSITVNISSGWLGFGLCPSFDNFQKQNNPECHTPSPEPFTIYL